jgi:hypothetical protein
MGHHADSACCASPYTIEIAIDSCIVDLVFGGGVVIHRHYL